MVKLLDPVIMLVLNEVISQDKTSGSIMMSKSQSSKNLTQAKVVNKSIEKKKRMQSHFCWF